MTEAKGNTKGLNFKAANLDQIWSCLQRSLLFEEPSGRWAKLLNQLCRQISGKSKDLTLLTLSQQECYFNEVFGTPADILDSTARIFNLVLALEDLKRFEAADFDIWFLSCAGGAETKGDDEFDSIPDIFSELAAAVLQSTPEQSQLAYLNHAWTTVPYWRVLESYGPWTGDPLADFVASVLASFDRFKLTLDTESIAKAQELFLCELKQKRSRLPANFHPVVIVLVEGNTEAVLLPKFLHLESGSSAYSKCMFIACGGANQLLRKYLQLRDTTTLAIMCVMDHDAIEQIDTIEPILRSGKDAMHIWTVGEIEDTFRQDYLLEKLNSYLSTLGMQEQLLPKDLKSNCRRTELLDRIWRARGLGDFDKVGFAQYLVGNSKMSRLEDVPEEARTLAKSLIEMVAASDA